MNILITGATGFIGGNLGRRLAREGHQVTGAVRRPEKGRSLQPEWRWMACDFTLDHRPEDWLPRIEGMDLVINAVGIIRESGSSTFDAVQSRTPVALFEACRQRGVRVIQISALGAEDPGETVRFLASKRVADDFVRQRLPDGQVLYPSVVIGEGGDSTALFEQLAALPVTPLTGDGLQRMRPVHVDALAEAACRLVADWPGRPGVHQVAGDRVYTVRELLASMRLRLGLGEARFLPVPMLLMRLGAVISHRLKLGALNPDTLALLQKARIPEASGVAVGLPSLEACWRNHSVSAAAAFKAGFDGLYLPLWLTLAALWLWTALCSGVWAVDSGLALLAKAGISPSWQPWLVYGGALLDGVLGLLMLLRWKPVRVLQVQTGVMALYLGVATVILPSLWLDPLGCLAKTVPLLWVNGVLLAYERARVL